MESNLDEEVRRASRYLRSLVSSPVDELPAVTEEVPNTNVPDLPGLDYGRTWYLPDTVTTNDAPPAQIRLQPEKDPAVAEAVSENAQAKAKSLYESGVQQAAGTAELCPEIQTDLELKKRFFIGNPLVEDIERDIRAHLSPDEPIVWSSWGFPWNSFDGHEGSKRLKLFVILSLVFLCALPFFGSVALVSYLAFVGLFPRRPLKQIWYALTDRRLIIVYRDFSFRSNCELEVTYVPLADIRKISLRERNNSIVVDSAYFFQMPTRTCIYSLRLFGFRKDNFDRFRAALPKGRFSQIGDALVGYVGKAPTKRPKQANPGTQLTTTAFWTAGTSWLKQIRQAVDQEPKQEALVVSAIHLPQMLLEIKSELRAGMSSDEHFVWTGEAEFKKSLSDLNVSVPLVGLAACVFYLTLGLTALGSYTGVQSLTQLAELLVMGAGSVYTTLLLLLMLRSNARTRPVSQRFKNCWYAITNKRVIIVSAQRKLGGSYVTREQHIPLSDIEFVRASKSDGTVLLIARHTFRLLHGPNRKEIRLSGLKREQVTNFVAAIPSTVSTDFAYNVPQPYRRGKNGPQF